VEHFPPNLILLHGQVSKKDAGLLLWERAHFWYHNYSVPDPASLSSLSRYFFLS
jgi:hypothetical protein